MFGKIGKLMRWRISQMMSNGPTEVFTKTAVPFAPSIIMTSLNAERLAALVKPWIAIIDRRSFSDWVSPQLRELRGFNANDSFQELNEAVRKGICLITAKPRPFYLIAPDSETIVLVAVSPFNEAEARRWARLTASPQLESAGYP